MTVGIISTLVKHGALDPKKSGPIHLMDPETARKRKLQQQVAARNLRKQLIQQAVEQGEPPPVFKKGRPGKYTEEEATQVKKEQNKRCWQVYKNRLKEGLNKFADMYDD